MREAQGQVPERSRNFCATAPRRRLEAFGSILREDFDAGRSDVDILVEFEPAVTASFTNYLNLKEALEGLRST